MESARIRVASPETHVRRILQFLLEVEGHEVRPVADGEEAWRALTSFRPDLVITAAALPGLDGPVLVAGMRARFDLAGIPVVMLVAEHAAADRLRALREGTDALVPLPFCQDELLLRVRNLLRTSAHARRLNRLPGLAAAEAAERAASTVGA